MIFSAQELVSKISHDMTLLPGDIIACGTSLGVGAMKEPVNTVTVAIEGIGELTNEYRELGLSRRDDDFYIAVIARSACDEAIQVSCTSENWIASLRSQ